MIVLVKLQESSEMFLSEKSCHIENFDRQPNQSQKRKVESLQVDSEGNKKKSLKFSSSDSDEDIEVG